MFSSFQLSSTKMSPKNFNPQAETVRLSGEIVAAYISNNPVPVAELPALIQATHSAIVTLAAGGGAAATNDKAEIAKLTAGQIRKSVTPDGIISFLDGKTYKTLKRHLTAKGLTPEDYRNRFGLPSDYPMVAPSYAEQRSALAKAIGLGRVATEQEPARKTRKAA